MICCLKSLGIVKPSSPISSIRTCDLLFGLSIQQFRSPANRVGISGSVSSKADIIASTTLSADHWGLM